MYSHKISRILFGILFVSFTMVHSAQANEHEAPKEEHGEAAGAPEGEKHEGGGGHEEGKSSLSPWVDLENKITELNSKIKSREANILRLIEEKNHLPNNSPELKNIVKEIVKEHKEMRSLAEEYEKNVTQLKYRFPERNAKTKRTYDRIEIKSVDEMEQALGVDGKLNRNLKRMRSQFKSEDKPAVTVKEIQTKPIPKSPKKDPTIEEAGSIILQK